MVRAAVSVDDEPAIGGGWTPPRRRLSTMRCAHQESFLRRRACQPRTRVLPGLAIGWPAGTPESSHCAWGEPLRRHHELRLTWGAERSRHRRYRAWDGELALDVAEPGPGAVRVAQRVPQMTVAGGEQPLRLAGAPAVPATAATGPGMAAQRVPEKPADWEGIVVAEPRRLARGEATL
jgi:hypothetical protein